MVPSETAAPEGPTDLARIRGRIMTLGERGCLIVDAERAQAVPAYSFPNAVDSNGAGDAFNAALATALIEGSTLDSAVRFANAVAGLCCTRWDTVPSYHTRAEVDAYLSKRG